MAARTLCECAFKPRAWLVPISVLLVLCAADVTEARRGSRSIEGAPKGTAAFGASETPVTDESTPSETEGKKSKRGKSRRGKAKLDKATEELLRQTGLPREKFDEVLSIGRRYVAESEWDTRHHMKYMDLQRAVARNIIMMGPEAVGNYISSSKVDQPFLTKKDSPTHEGMWSNAAMNALDRRIHYQWGPTSDEWYSVPKPYPDEVKRISANGLSYEQLLAQWDGSGPLLLTDVSFPALNWTKSWLSETLRNHKVKIQMRVPGPSWAKSGNSHKFYVNEPLSSFSNVVAESSGIRWCYSMDEEFFFEEQGGIPGWMKAQVEPGATLPQWDAALQKERDLFQLFPDLAQPNNMMLLWGGSGLGVLGLGRLHVDPYNWTGTNGVIFGEKYWKFYPPSFPAVDALHGVGHSAQGYINTPHYFSPIDAFNPDLLRYPEFLEAEKHVVHGVQKAGEVMLIPSGWWHMAYNPEETLAFSSQFLNPQNYRPALQAVVTGNPVVADCVEKKGYITPAKDGRLDFSGGRLDYDWTAPTLKPPYAEGDRAIEEFEAVMECLDDTMEAVPIEGKEDLGKTSSLVWGPRRKRKSEL